MRKMIWIFVVFCVASIASRAHSQEIWVGKDGNIKNVDARGMLMEGGEFYLATGEALYKTREAGDRWRSVFFVNTGADEISCLDGNSRNIFVGTRRGLFRSQDGGSNWKKVFSSLIPERSRILCLAVSGHRPGLVMVGTAKGIYLSENSGDRWHDISGSLKNVPVRCLAINEGYFYAGTDTGLYYRDQGNDGWERAIVKSAPETASSDDENETEQGEEEEKYSSINCVAIDGQRVYVGNEKKIFYSDDKAQSWYLFDHEGLDGEICHILPSGGSGRLYCATRKGVFEFSEKESRWFELYKGFDKTVNARKLMYDGDDEKHLWAVTDRGLYRLESGRYAVSDFTDIEKSLKTLKVTFDSEPSFGELRQAAIKFAEVSPEKIKNWRAQARMKALLPKVSFGIDNDSSDTYEIYTSATRDYVVSGPPDTSRGWDVSVSWELGDLIWSTDQTSIDVRSRLMVQLRNDILDDLRRVYYERKRIQFELAAAPPADIKARYAKEMRLEELTQAIDDLTGNYLSDNLNTAKQ
ncbi:MAG: hypothetical protein PHP46_06905 [Candidatus Omnitrophica bacterium]|nr:hypothetical protein [Candidatus Omnitrophota bacterium]